MKWQTRDWFWLLLFTLYAHGFFLIVRNDSLNNLISYVSTFVSIALAGVAIYISVREATKTDNVKDEINLILGEMREKLDQVDTKVSKMDPDTFNRITEKYKDDMMQEVVKQLEGIQELNKDNVKQLVNEVLNKNVDIMNHDLKNVVKKSNDKNKLGKILHDLWDSMDAIKYLARKYEIRKKYKIQTIYDELKINLALNMDEDSFNEFISNLREFDYIKVYFSKDNETYVEFTNKFQKEIKNNMI